MDEGSVGEGGVLGKIAKVTRRRVETLKRDFPQKRLKEIPFYKRKPSDFRDAFRGASPRIIAEVKFASPSAGNLRDDRPPTPAEALKIAGGYLKNGACAVSILTEPDFFYGSPKFLYHVRSAYGGAYILMKDFFLDPYQFELARAHGADAVLLIASLLGDELKAMLDAAQGMGLSALVEVHDEGELEAAKSAGARIIGVNNRDLKTLKTDLGVSKRLAPLASDGIMIAESGIETREDIAALSECGYKGFLIGSSFMRTEDPGAALKELRG